MSASTPVRLGLIGAGAWGRNLIRTIKALPGVRLTRLSTRNSANHSLVGPQCHITPHWEQLVCAHDVDGVIITTPPPLHATMVRETIAAGKPVLVEKPLTNDLASAQALAQFVADQKGYVLVDHTLLFHSGFAALKQELKHLGPVLAIESIAGNYGPFRSDTPPLWDWGPHSIALCQNLLQATPQSVRAHCTELQVMENARGENLELRLGFAGGIKAQLRIGNLLPEKRRRFTVQAQDGTLVLDDLAETKLVRSTTATSAPSPSANPSAPGEAIPLSPELPLARLVRHFAQAITSGHQPAADLHFALEVMETLDRCERELTAEPTPPTH